MHSRVMCLVVSVCVCMYVHVCMYVMYMYVDKKWAVWGLTTEKSPVSVIYCSLVDFNSQKRGLYNARRFVLGKKSHSTPTVDTFSVTTVVTDYLA